jgi:NitT/TauT family transport system ATP-binding protein
VPAPPIVELHGVSRTYDGGVRALAPLDLVVREREFLTLVGPSGCGKSTLLRLIAGLLLPTTGEIRRWGENDPHAQPRRIGFVFQAPTLMPWANVARNVRLPLDLAHMPHAEAKAHVAEALELVGLADAKARLPRELTGGMQMRASIARALVVRPSLLLMDEPFGALDEFTRQRLDGELLALWSSQRFTVTFVTHSIHEAVFLSTRIVVMAAHPGRIVDACDIDEPYPRDESFRVSQAFAQYAARVSASVAAAGTAAPASTEAVR